ncbi:DUF2007 domain-containing protein [Hymenobacter setariae]|uniref:DUF2007 domain-containing protein n=1 Tax=Hymenobacter setariae TaxID=2594794 RepID=A0A558BUT8_9BACT|nr:DUF2007 domain-containing protein [Hymenobacter setariae]TVT40259.1 DUF2007 domain-containing protein [Hymenobacter setariae]
MSTGSSSSRQENIIVLDSYYEPVAAHLARTKLEAAGIPCFLTNENLVSLNRMYSPVAGGVRLHVYQRDAAQATEVLRELPVMQAVAGGLAEPTKQAVTCPRCGSHDVAFDVPAEPANAASWLATLLARLRHYFAQGQTHHCFNCGLDY